MSTKLACRTPFEIRRGFTTHLTRSLVRFWSIFQRIGRNLRSAIPVVAQGTFSSERAITRIQYFELVLFARVCHKYRVADERTRSTADRDNPAGRRGGLRTARTERERDQLRQRDQVRRNKRLQREYDRSGSTSASAAACSRAAGGVPAGRAVRQGSVPKPGRRMGAGRAARFPPGLMRPTRPRSLRRVRGAAGWWHCSA